MKHFRKKCLALAVGATMALPAAVQATNGYMAIGYGMASLGMGGVGVALPQDANAAAANPAGMAYVGTRIDIGFQLFNPPRRAGAAYGQYDFQTPRKSTISESIPVDEAKSGSNLFLIPGMGGNYKFNRKITVGMTAIGNGANTRYPQNFFALTGTSDPESTLGVQLMQMQMLPTVTYKVKKNHAIGASLIIGVQAFRAYGLQNFAFPEFEFTSNSDKLTNNGNDWSWGAGVRVGWLGKFLKKKLSLGAMYSSRVYMTPFKKYEGLFANKGDFDIPPLYALGVAWKINKQWTVAADVQRIEYASIASVGNRHGTGSIQDPCSRPISYSGTCVTPGATATPRSKQLGNKDGWGFGWEDQTAYKLGVMFKPNKTWTLRAGFNYGKSPVPDDQLLFNMLAPAVTERHATLGFGYKFDKMSGIDFSWVHAFTRSQVCAVEDGCYTLLTPKNGNPNAYVAAEMGYDSVGLAYWLRLF